MKVSVLKLFGGESRIFRQAVTEYKEESDKLLDSLRCGVLLGSQQAIEKLKKKIGKYIHREKPQTRDIKQQGSLGDAVYAIAVQLGVLHKELEAYRKPVRGCERLMRDILIFLLWKKTYYSLNKVGEYFKIGYTAVVNARKRGESYLLKNPKFIKMIDSDPY